MDTSEQPEDAPEESSDNPQPEDPSSQDHAPESNVETSSETTAEQSADELPEDVELTPELLDEEAQRNDFVIRGLVLLLAIICGCMTIADTEVLLQAKIGDYLAGHGILPGSTDLFSATANGAEWLNRTWLWDILLSAIHTIAGPIGWTVLTVVCSAAIFKLLLESRHPAAPSWWPSVCIALSLPVCFSQLVPTSSLMTLLGTATTLWLVWQYRLGRCEKKIWLLCLLFLFWTNCDERAFFGLVILLTYGIGEFIGSMVGTQGFVDSSERRTYWLVTGACVLVSMVGPYGWNQLLAPFELYGVTDPAFRDYYQMSVQYLRPHQPLWAGHLFELPTAAGLLLAAIALVTMFMNREKLDGGDIALWVGVMALCVIARRELAPASFVFAVIAGWNGQNWYLSRGSVSETVTQSDVLLSRGGRLVTALAMLAFGIFVLSLRFQAADGRYPGFGLTQSLRTEIDGLRDALDGSFDEKPFNFRPREGDIIIWLSQQPFIDSRLGLYRDVGKGKNLAKLHDEVRYALLSPSEGDAKQGKPNIWKAAFNEYGITHVVPRLSDPDPAYFVHFDMLTSPDWRMTKLNAVASVFYRASGEDELSKKISEFLKSQSLDFMQMAFGDKAEILSPEQERTTWGRRKSRYEQGLIGGHEDISPALARAKHYLVHLELAETRGPRLSPEAAIAFAYLAIRGANETLADAPNNVDAYRTLGLAYRYLGLWEARVAQATRATPLTRLRLYETLAALGQAVTIDPAQAQTHLVLSEIYLQNGKLDLALNSLNNYLKTSGETVPTVANAASESGSALSGEKDQQPLQKPTSPQEQRLLLRDKLQEQMDLLNDQIAQALANNAPVMALAQGAWQQGATLKALEIMERDPIEYRKNPDYRRFHAMLLMEAARPAEAYAELSELLDEVPLYGVGRTDPRLEPFVLATLGLGQYSRVTELCNGGVQDIWEVGLRSAMNTFPLVGPRNNSRPVIVDHGLAVLSTLGRTSNEMAKLQTFAAVSELEAGRIEEAQELFTKVIENSPNTGYALLAAFYYQLLAQKPYELELKQKPLLDADDPFVQAAEPAKQETPVKESAEKTPPSNEESEQEKPQPSEGTPVEAPAP
ncbi:tetratricopeptide repeat protein [Calycomorphotria hydatis]|uniref:Tetratricopeptide repeat protein n=1 Tax=Calycomorphotria hydatis TaxID=2528027 RepID=A0A517T6M1_9PLAN|nr:hypothetical protein [Calycomorphotria hydatis]QDT64025.1 hypothetical protein V22_12550 [Calycomorphotria hydatis]